MRTVQFVVVLVMTSACARIEASGPTLQVDMANVDLRVAPDTVLHIHELRGQFVPVGRRAPHLDDTRSYAVQIESGEIAIDAASLNALVTRALGGNRSNVEKLQLTIAEDGTMRQKGAIDKGIDIPFSAKSSVSVTPDGRIRVSTSSVKGFGVPMKPMMKIFGIEMDDLVRIKPGAGVEVHDNDLILDPSRLLATPAIRGRLNAVRIEHGSLVQVFTSSSPSRTNIQPTSPNHIYWRGGELSFGKLTMVDTDLELIDRDPKDPFDFSVEDWNAQLIAGYSKTLGNKGLRAYMPDYNDLRRER